ncbi:hypothetical protein ACP179_01100 (plasmid) [Xenorhabdus stockiae]|uniref:hypothetical protein n=1 Tax=Xenorhabdus stockiae TaxID=351614 RepID=UPI003CE819E6
MESGYLVYDAGEKVTRLNTDSYGVTIFMTMSRPALIVVTAHLLDVNDESEDRNRIGGSEMMSIWKC